MPCGPLATLAESADLRAFRTVGYVLLTQIGGENPTKYLFWLALNGKTPPWNPGQLRASVHAIRLNSSCSEILHIQMLHKIESGAFVLLTSASRDPYAIETLRFLPAGPSVSAFDLSRASAYVYEYI